MRNSKHPLSGLGLLATAVAAAILSAAPTLGQRLHNAVLRARRVYPERGQRDQLRAFRRAQGGPGIELVNGQWRPRHV